MTSNAYDQSMLALYEQYLLLRYDLNGHVLVLELTGCRCQMDNSGWLHVFTTTIITMPSQPITTPPAQLRIRSWATTAKMNVSVQQLISQQPIRRPLPAIAMRVYNSSLSGHCTTEGAGW